MAATDDVNITVTADSAPLVAALADASSAFGDMAVAADSSAGDIADAMASLASAIDSLSAEIDVLAGSMDDLAASSGTAATAVAATGDAADAATAEVITLSDAVAALGAAVDDLMGGITPLLTTLGTLIAVMGAMTIINDVSDWIENLISQMFQLDEQTQKTVNSWQYLFAQIGVAGSGKANAANLAGWAFQESPNLPFTAVDLRGAISELGTAPDTTVAGKPGQFLGMSPQEIEQFMPYLADLASTLGASANGGQGTTLMQAANAIRMAEMGRSMELKSQLNITPQMLMQYGLQGTITSGGIGVHITNPSSLFTSIENFVNARGLRGAAQEQEVNTFWGASSSFQDYIQNFLQTIGGINPATGDSDPNSFFGQLQNLLIGANRMLGQAMQQPTKKAPVVLSPEAQRVAGKLKGAPYEGSPEEQPTLGGLIPIMEKILGGGVQSGESLVGGIISGFTGSGGKSMVDDLFNSLKKFSEWLTSAPIQGDLKHIGEGIGQFASQAAKLAQDVLPVMAKGFGEVVQAAEMFWHSLSPEQRAGLEAIPADIMLVVTAISGLIATFLALAADVNTGLNHFESMVGSWAKNLQEQFKQWGSDFIGQLISGIESRLGDLGNTIGKVAGSIAAKLHFSKPDEGPLADSDQWMPDMMAMFAEGIERGLPAVARASQQAAAMIGAPFALAGHVAAGAGGYSSTSYGPTTNYGSSSSTANFYGASQLELEVAMQRVLQNMDRQGALVFGAPGGRFIFGGH